MASSCNEEEMMQTLSSVLARNDASKLCRMLSAEEPKQRRGQKPIEDFMENKFSLPAAWQTSNAQQAAGNSSCRRVELPQDLESDYLKREPGLDYLPLERFESMLNDDPIVAPYSKASNTVCTCPKIPLALLPPQQKSSTRSCRCGAHSKVKGPEKVSIGTHMVNASGGGGSDSKQVATQSERPTEPAKIQKPPVDISKCKKTEGGSCPCCKRKSKGKKIEKPDDTKSNRVGNILVPEKSSMSVASKTTKKKRKTVAKKSSTTLSAPLTVNRSRTSKSNRKKKHLPGEFVEESKTSLSSGPKLTMKKVKGMHPGTKVGHQTCCLPLIRVPKAMGWLWNTSEGAGTIKPGRGWRPGAIKKDVHDIMMQIKKLDGRSGKQDANKSQADIFEKSRKIRLSRGDYFMREEIEQPTHYSDTKPTLHLHKSGGRYNVVMHPPAKQDDILFSFDKQAFDSCTPTCDRTSTVTNDSLQFDLTTPYSLYKNIPPTKKACVKIQKDYFMDEH